LLRKNNKKSRKSDLLIKIKIKIKKKKKKKKLGGRYENIIMF